MFEKNNRKIGAIAMLAIMMASCAAMLFPCAAMAQYGEVLYSPGQSTRTLRTPLIPGAPNGAPGQAAAPGQPPPLGNGPVPAPEIGGDGGGPFAPPSGMADPTHGNIFPAQGGRPGDPPWMYVPGAGRRQTQNGQDQGVYDFGQEQNGTQWGPGGKNGGTDVQNEGGPRNGAQGSGSGGEENGTKWGPGGKNGGSTVQNDGGPRGGANQSGPGAESDGTKIVNNGGPKGGSIKDGSGGEMNGQKVVNNGGPRGDAEKNGDRMFQHAQQPNRYEYNGPLPTVRTFSRYLVILGVVFSTVFIAMAAWAMVFGSPYGGSRVIGAAGGLILLLAGYTIWKIVQMNTFHANSTGVESHYRGGAPQNPHNGPHTIDNGPNGSPFAGPQDPGGGAGGNNDHRGGNGQTINAATHGGGGGGN